MNDIIKIYRTSKETTYNFALCTSGALIYLGLIYAFMTARDKAGLFVLLFYALAIGVFFLVAALLFRANAMGNMVLITEEQFPHLHRLIVEGAERLGMKSAPDAFLYNSNGLLNAFARQTLGDDYLLLTSALVDATTDEQVKFVIGHELGHHAAGHLSFWGYWLRFPARVIPFLHKAYLRQCEYTCDRIGFYLSRNADHCCSAIQMLGCGCQKLNGGMNLQAFEKQETRVPPLTGFVAEILRSHPRLTRRVIELKKTRLFD